MWGLKQNLDPIGLAVLTIIGYKWADKQTDTQTSKVYVIWIDMQGKCNLLAWQQWWVRL